MSLRMRRKITQTAPPPHSSADADSEMQEEEELLPQESPSASSTSSSFPASLEEADASAVVELYLNRDFWDVMLMMWLFTGGFIRSMTIGILMILFGQASIFWKAGYLPEGENIWPHLVGVLQLVVGPVEFCCIVFILFTLERIKKLTGVYVLLKLSAESVFLVESLAGRGAIIPFGDTSIGFSLLIQAILLPCALIWRTAPFSREPVFPRWRFRRTTQSSR